MSKRFSLILFCLVFLIVVSPLSVLAEISVGVQEEDWIEYNLTYTGSPPDEYPKWIRIDFTNIQRTSITVDFTVERLDGSSDTINDTFDLETGIPDLLLIPADLDIGDIFYHQEFGNITIAGTGDYTYTGVKRAVVYATVDQISLHWDKATGILLQTDQIKDDFTKQVLVYNTNIWQTQTNAINRSGEDPTVLYMVIVAVIAVGSIIAFF